MNGPVKSNEPIHAFINATLHPSGNERVENAIMLVSGERILYVGKRKELPKQAIVHDLKGKHIWPGIVEPYATEGFAKRQKAKGERPGAHFWNDAIHASFNAADHFTIDEKAMEAWRKMGVTSIVTHRNDGIIRGTGIAVHTAGRNAQKDIIDTESSLHFSFNKGSSTESYPNSLMGSIALLRQTFLDASWYASFGNTEQSDIELEALNQRKALPFVFETDDVDDLYRVDMLAKELDHNFIIKGTGYEYLRGSIPAEHSLLIPVTYPDAYDVSDPFDALEVKLTDMQHWENASGNAANLAERETRFAFTSDGLKKKKEYLSRVRKAVEAGLDSAQAMLKLTATPAEMFGMKTGKLEQGAYADFLLTSEHLLAEKNIIHETWVAGERFVYDDMNVADLTGEFNLNINEQSLLMELTKGKKELAGHLRRNEADTVKIPISGSSDGRTLNLVFDGSSFGLPGKVRANGMIHNKGTLLDGQAQNRDATWISWSAIRQSSGTEKAEKEKTDEEAPKPERILQPHVFADAEKRGSILFKNARVWTNTEQGILKKADVLVVNGTIAAVGENIELDRRKLKVAPTMIDASGMHLTTGIVDEHTHIALHKGVNEGSQAVTAEVRIGDVIDPDHIALYRGLAGGVTTVQLLHGSANPIGGQSALIKLRWGNTAEGLKIKNAPKHIKFALGENVKQTNWYNASKRFPVTRMGVEQVFYDAFYRTREYDRNKMLSTLRPQRPDLELEALAEILRGERSITCHSYVMSEVDMLMHVADSIGFKMNTFTHILEGYKLSHKLKEHGVNASTFSDWWAYKYEVRDAIPYNAALMHQAGVNTGINSDDVEMGRRLNQEAAKAVKYGGVSEEEAWKMVTLNPAKMLKLDDRIGSIAVGKDADLVLWNSNPLSIAAQAQMTFIDGHRYFDVSEDRALQEQKEQERQRLIHLMLDEKKKGKPTQKVKAEEEHHWHCDTIGDRP